MLNILFPSACIPIIKYIHIPIADCQDRLVWGFSLLFFTAIDGAWRKDSRVAAAWVIRDESGICGFLAEISFFVLLHWQQNLQLAWSNSNGVYPGIFVVSQSTQTLPKYIKAYFM